VFEQVGVIEVFQRGVADFAQLPRFDMLYGLPFILTGLAPFSVVISFEYSATLPEDVEVVL